MLYEKSLLEFIFVTLLLGGWLAFMTGKAFASTWRGLPLLVMATIVLSLVVRFIHFAVFEGNLFTLYYLCVDFAVLSVIAWLGFQTTRVKQMSEQYWWLYEKKNPLIFAKRENPLTVKKS